MTEQHHEKACNINSIIARYQKTGLVDHVQKYEGVYGDVTGADFKSAMDLVKNAETEFHELPSSVRKHFDNDPSAYLDLVMTDEGVQELTNILNPEEKNDPPEPPSDGPKEQVTEENLPTDQTVT